MDLIKILNQEPNEITPSYEDNEPQWMIKDLLHADDVVRISSAIGSGSARIACEISAAIAENRSLFDRFEYAGATDSVLYLVGNGKNPRAVEKEIAGTVERGSKKIKILSLQELDTSLADSSVRDQLLEYFKNNPLYRTVVFDSTSSLFRPLNSGCEKGEKLKLETDKWIMELKEMQILQIWLDPQIHGKKSFQVEDGIADLAVKLTRDHGKEVFSVNMDFLFSRNNAKGAGSSLCVYETKHEDGRLRLVSRPAIENDFLKTALMLTQGYTQADIARQMKVNQSTISRWRDRLNAEGIITVQGTRADLSDKGLKLLKEAGLIN